MEKCTLLLYFLTRKKMFEWWMSWVSIFIEQFNWTPQRTHGPQGGEWQQTLDFAS